MTSGSKKQSGIEVAVGGEVMMGKGSVRIQSVQSS